MIKCIGYKKIGEKIVPNIKSAEKRVEVIDRKTLENQMIRTKMRNIIKKFNNYIDTLKIEEAEKLLPELMSVVNETASKGVITKNSASNKISRCSARLSGVKSGKITVHIKKDNKTIAAEKAQAARAKAEAERAETLKKMQERAAAKEAEKAAKLEAEKAAKLQKKSKKA